MKSQLGSLAALLLFCTLHTPAAVLYVDVHSATPIAPYTNWATASRVIQDAVDAASAGDLVLVTNGVYALGGRQPTSFFITNRVTITNALTVQSVNGPTVTSIQGYRVSGNTSITNAVRCAQLSSNAVLSGFTLTNGSAGIGNDVNGGAVEGGRYAGVVTNCVLVGNYAPGAGGGATGVILLGCVLSSNLGGGGGAASDSILLNCQVTNNTAGWAAGILGGAATNCLFSGNHATNYGGASGFATLVNCTVVSNWLQAGYSGNGGGSYNDTVLNSIVYGNNAPNGSNYYGSSLRYSCTAPLAAGTGNFASPPLLNNPAAGDFHLQSNSPCINAGNNGYLTASVDLEGKPRFVGGTADLGAYEFQGTTRYVNLASTNPLAPYSDWSYAATNIQDAVDAANPGDVVLVADGLYQTGGRMLFNSPPTNRVSVTKVISVQSVNGPTVTTIQGYQMPGVTNGASAVRCVYLTNGAVLAGFTLTHGASYAYAPGGTWNYGGAVFCQSTNIMNALSTAVVSNCVLVGNSAAVGHVAYGGRLTGCVLAFNSGGGSDCLLNNCTVVSNSGSIGPGGHFSTLNNCIVYYNTASTGPSTWGSTLNYCCVPDVGGTGNITNAPALVDLVHGDFHLQPNSPCINAGNNGLVGCTADLDGNSRLQGGTVDMGAYEVQNPPSLISYAWLQQYGLATDGSADFADGDHDGLNNWQEWLAGTDPTLAASVLRMTGASNNTSGITVSWQSVSGKTYSLQRSSNLSLQPAFTSLQSNIPGQAGITSFTDTNATGAGPYFYRVGVQ